MIDNKRLGCLEYCIISARSNHSEIGQGDILVQRVKELQSSEQKVLGLQRSRFEYCKLSYNDAGKVEITLADKERFDLNLAEEKAEINKVADIKRLFARLDPLFKDACDELKGLEIPTLKGLITFRQNQSNWSVKSRGFLRENLEKRLTSVYAKNKTIEDITSDPDWIAYKAEADKNLFNLNQNIKIAEEYIQKVYSVMEMK